MLQKLQQVAAEGTLRIQYAYLGQIRKDEDRKLLAHADAQVWDDVEPSVRALLEQHLLQALEGPLGEVNFPCMYTGEVLSVAKVATTEFDRTISRPAVELLEAMRDQPSLHEQRVLDWGNALAYKVMAAGAIKNHLLGIVRFEMTPHLDAKPVPFVFGTLCDLDDREESLFDENKGKFVTLDLHNVVKRSVVGRAVFFPCLDDDGKELADLLVYAGSGAGAWFKALEATRRFSPRKEGQALVRMITEEAEGADVPHDLFRRMGDDLAPKAADGLPAEAVATSLEKAMGQGIDRQGFLARWETAFGDQGYRPRFESIFAGDDADIEKPTRLKMQAGEIKVDLEPRHLAHFRQVTVGEQTFIVFAVPARAKVVAGKDRELHIKPVALDDLLAWLAEDHG